MNGLTLILALVCGCGEQKEDTGFVDADGDGVLNSTDCDDADSTVHGPTTWYEDADGDGFGNPDVFTEACEVPDGYVADNTDCNDTSNLSYPSNTEICDDLDNDCDESVDEDVTITFYTDADDDGYGDFLSPVQVCMSTESTVSNADDCDDTNDQINPGMIEICNDGWDNDCDGTANDCEYEGETSLADAWAIFRGEEETDYAGQSMANAGDVDRDGLDDVVIGAPGSGEAGAVFFVSGTSTGEIVLSEATTLAMLTGEEVDDNAGASVAALGDVNGDGFDDFLVGADFSSARADYAGAAYLVFGLVSGVRSLSLSDAILYGIEADGFLGNPVAGVGDMSGDGVADVAVGALGAADDAGVVYLFDGSLVGDIDVESYQSRFEGEAVLDRAGSALTHVGDTNGDGWDDLLIGARRNNSQRGAVYLVLGPSSGAVNLSEADAKLSGEANGDYAGAALSTAGDVDADGYQDLFVGAYGNDAGGSSAGAAYLVLGPVSGSVDLSAATAKFVGEENDFVGGSVAVLEDTNGDGWADYLMGADGNDAAHEDAGAAYLFYGPASGVIDLNGAAAVLTGETAEGAAGSIVASGGDVNADGFNDFLVSALDSDFAGAVYLILGQGM